MCDMSANVDLLQFFLTNALRHSTVSFINSAKSVCGSNWNKRFHSTIDKLRKNTDIKILQFLIKFLIKQSDWLRLNNSDIKKLLIKQSDWLRLNNSDIKQFLIKQSDWLRLNNSDIKQFLIKQSDWLRLNNSEINSL